MLYKPSRLCLHAVCVFYFNLFIFLFTDLWTYLPFLYSCVSFVGVLMLLGEFLLATFLPIRKLKITKIEISFTLYPAHNIVGRGNLVLRHTVPHFLQNSGGIACWVAELNAALWMKNGNINLSKYFISSSGDRTHNQSILHDWPHTAWSWFI